MANTAKKTEETKKSTWVSTKIQSDLLFHKFTEEPIITCTLNEIREVERDGKTEVQIIADKLALLDDGTVESEGLVILGAYAILNFYKYHYPEGAIVRIERKGDAKTKSRRTVGEYDFDIMTRS